MKHRLVWNQVAAEEWQAGSAVRYYSIIKEGGRYAVSLCNDLYRLRVVAIAHSLQAAKDAAAIDIAKVRA